MRNQWHIVIIIKENYHVTPVNTYMWWEKQNEPIRRPSKNNNNKNKSRSVENSAHAITYMEKEHKMHFK